MAMMDKPTCSLATAMNFLTRKADAQFDTGRRVGGSPLLIGKPGEGKSAGIKAAFEKLAAKRGEKILVWTVTLADREVTDVRGVGVPVKNTAEGGVDLIYSRSGALPPRHLIDQYDRIVLFIDEVGAATQDHMKTIAAPLHDYVLGDEVLNPEFFFVVAASNGTADRAGAQRLPSHILNRCVCLFIGSDHRGWLDYAYTAGLPAIGVAFVEMRPSLLTESEVPAEPNTPWATFRSYTNMLTELSALYEGDMTKAVDDPVVSTAVACGYVGAGVAKEFFAFVKTAGKLTPLKEIVADPEGCRVPEDSGAAFAQAAYLIEWTPTTRTAKDMETIEAMVVFLGRLRADMLVGTLIRMQRKNPAITSTRAFGEVARENRGLVGMTLAHT